MSNKQLNKFILLAIIVLTLLLLWLVKSTDSESEEYNFAVADTAAISRIFIADMKGNSILLDRNSNSWKIDNKHRVQNKTMEVILRTIKDISVQRPVSESAYNKVIADLATNGVKVEVYQNFEKEPTKTYTIGGNTPDHLGTYMLMENAKYPYIMHIIGFNGILGPKYGLQGNTINSGIWRDKSVFNLRTEQISSITLINEKGNDSSFTIKKDNGQLTLLNHQRQQLNANQKTLLSYMNLYQKINCESFKNDTIKERLNAEKKLYTLILSHQNGTDTLKVYQMRDKDEKRRFTRSKKGL